MVYWFREVTKIAKQRLDCTTSGRRQLGYWSTSMGSFARFLILNVEVTSVMVLHLACFQMLFCLKSKVVVEIQPMQSGNSNVMQMHAVSCGISMTASSLPQMKR